MTLLATEHATLETWRAAEMETRDGWRLLASSGVSGRVNAVWPIAFAGANLDDAIHAVEAWYAARGLPCVFKLTDALTFPKALPAALAARGYAPSSDTAIMIRALAAGDARGDPVILSPTLPDAFDAALAAAAEDEADARERRAIALRAPAPVSFALLPGESGADAIGMCAVSAAYAGVFLMRTRRSARRRGCARQILRALLAWAQTQGATTAFLQVETDNAPACALYEREGFHTLSRYRYWRRAPEGRI